MTVAEISSKTKHINNEIIYLTGLKLRLYIFNIIERRFQPETMLRVII